MLGKSWRSGLSSELRARVSKAGTVSARPSASGPVCSSPEPRSSCRLFWLPRFHQQRLAPPRQAGPRAQSHLGLLPLIHPEPPGFSLCGDRRQVVPGLVPVLSLPEAAAEAAFPLRPPAPVANSTNGPAGEGHGGRGRRVLPSSEPILFGRN